MSNGPKDTYEYGYAVEARQPSGSWWRTVDFYTDLPDAREKVRALEVFGEDLRIVTLYAVAQRQEPLTPEGE